MRTVFGVSVDFIVAALVVVALFALVSTARTATLEPSTETLIAEVCDA